jgi:hypothetical protein
MRAAALQAEIDPLAARRRLCGTAQLSEESFQG